MIYVVEDDASIRELVIYTLQSTGFEATGFERGIEFFDALSKTLPSLVLLDIMLPQEDGISILKKLRHMPATKEVPVIMVTAKSMEYDKVMGLDFGADDYVTKPFGMMELVSRIRALLRRTKQEEGTKELKIGEIHMDILRHLVLIGNTEVQLTYKEFELLRVLMEAKGMVLTRDALLAQIWGYDFDGETRTVDVHIRTLRQKLGESGNQVETVRGIGYRIGG